MNEKLINKIENADLYDVVKKTPLEHLENLSKELSNNIYQKREDLQLIHSFKIRGAYYKIKQLSTAEKKRGVIASSAGNHAQGVAFSAQKNNIKATIIMPKTTPEIKVKSVKLFGAKVILHGNSYDEAFEYAKKLCKKEQLTFIHPFDDDDVIAGQGTIGKEILEQLKQIDYLFIPVGGGGLIAGISTYIKAYSPSTKIIAVEPEKSNCFQESLRSNTAKTLSSIEIFADGVAVKAMGKITFEYAKKTVDDAITVTTDEICAAIKDIYDNSRAIAEPAGALSLAGIKKYIKDNEITQKNICSILCGGNINFHRLRHISERTEIGENKEILIAIKIPEKKGSFLNLSQHFKDFEITEFNYRFTSNKEATVFVGFKINTQNEKNAIFNQLNTHNYTFIDLTDNECAKIHTRYMIGGKNKSKNEHIIRFQFPELPGALLKFLESFGTTFDISLFHYRNHGADYGRVLVGIIVNNDQYNILTQKLQDLNYHYIDETNNDAIKLFL
ncbi:threonine ammonia-lyase, biosynthetic [Candidatus Marinamargulisbacteria bacterium SCGC AG-414-C22]|nr:threonine ammonia-lyase, biosynthetic [Candidatus Marinamargulisbacteria bacterium SCGC AG-414-C22]